MEHRLEDLPQFNPDLKTQQRRLAYEGKSIEELRKLWHEGIRKTEHVTNPSLLTRLLHYIATSLDGIVFDTTEEHVVHNEDALVDKRERILDKLKTIRRDERRGLSDLTSVRSSLDTYVTQLNRRYKQDKHTYPYLVSFAKQLTEEIDDAQQRADNATSQRQATSYRNQVQHGQRYFNNLCNEMEYLKSELALLDNTRQRYSKLLINIDGVINKKHGKLRESLVKIKEAEMTQSLDVLIDNASGLKAFDDDLHELERINAEAYAILDEMMQRVDDEVGYADPNPLDEGARSYHTTVYDQNIARFKELKTTP
jgi:chromosome segregation ATPase